MRFLTLHYKEYGNKEGPLLIFLHGGGVSSWMWDRQVEFFTDYYCVTVDLPEQGTNIHYEKFSIVSSAFKLNQLIEKIANDKAVIVVGFSLGAQVLIHMVSSKPYLIDYAMINSAWVRPSKIGAKFISPIIGLTYPLIQNKRFSKLQAKEMYIDDEHFEKYYDESNLMKRQTLVRILEENMSFEMPDKFSKANTKILITVGENEKSIMRKSACHLLDANSNGTGIIISDVGHGAPLATPNVFNHIMEYWLNISLHADER